MEGGWGGGERRRVRQGKGRGEVSRQRSSRRVETEVELEGRDQQEAAEVDAKGKRRVEEGSGGKRRHTTYAMALWRLRGQPAVRSNGAARQAFTRHLDLYPLRSPLPSASTFSPLPSAFDGVAEGGWGLASERALAGLWPPSACGWGLASKCALAGVWPRSACG